MHHQRTAFFGFDDIGKGDRVRLGHVAAHNQNSVAIDQILWEGRRAAASKRSTQTGYSGTVSYTGLVLDRDDAKSEVEEFLHQIVFFNVQRGPAQ